MTSLEQSHPGSLRLVAADSARFGIIALIAFLTLVDLFAAQAILPSLVQKFAVSRATMGPPPGGHGPPAGGPTRDRTSKI